MFEEMGWKPEGYRSPSGFISDEYKLSLLARMLSGYQESVWQKLRPDRKKTYLRAASQLLFGWKDFVEVMKGWAANASETKTNR